MIDYPTCVVLEQLICPTHPKLHGPVRSGGREPGLINGEGGVGMSWSWTLSRENPWNDWNDGIYIYIRTLYIYAHIYIYIYILYVYIGMPYILPDDMSETMTESFVRGSLLK